MGKTDNTRPYELQAADPTKPGRIVHDHLVEHSRMVRRPVRWGELVAELSEELSRWDDLWREQYGCERQAVHPELVYGLTFGQWRKPSYFWRFSNGQYYRQLRYYLNRLLKERVEVDLNQDLTDNTLVGYRHDWRYWQEPVPCDYQPDNELVNRKLAQSLGWSGARNSPEQRRCGRALTTPQRGGRHGYSKWHRAELRRWRRSLRQRERLALRYVQLMAGEADFDLPPRWEDGRKLYNFHRD